MDMLILRPLDTLKQGQRWRVAGIKDLWENEEDKSKAWQNERMPFWKGNEWWYLLFCPNWIFLLLENWLLRVNQRKKEESTVFPSRFFFFVIIVFTVTGRDSEAYLHTSESSFAYQTHRKADGLRAASMWGGGNGGALFLHPAWIQVWRGGPVELGTASPAGSQQVLGRAAPSAQVLQVGNMKTQRSIYRRRISAFHQGLAKGGEPSPPTTTSRTGLRSCCSANTQRKEDSQERVDQCGLWTSLGGQVQLIKDIIS